MPSKFRLKLATIAIVSLIAGFSLSQLVVAQGGGTQPPNDTATFSYQGRLTDTSGNPVNGSKAVTFRLWDSITGGNLLWNDTYSIEVNEGYFSTLLGQDSDAAISSDLIQTHPDLFIEVEVDGETLTPREKLTPVPFAVHAWSVAEDSIDTANIKANSVTPDKISSGVVKQITISKGTNEVSTSSNSITLLNNMSSSLQTGQSIIEINFNAGFKAHLNTAGSPRGIEYVLKVDNVEVARRSHLISHDDIMDDVEFTFYHPVSAGNHTVEVWWKSIWGTSTVTQTFDSHNRNLIVKELKAI